MNEILDADIAYKMSNSDKDEEYISLCKFIKTEINKAISLRNTHCHFCFRTMDEDEFIQREELYTMAAEELKEKGYKVSFRIEESVYYYITMYIDWDMSK